MYRSLQTRSMTLMLLLSLAMVAAMAAQGAAAQAVLREQDDVLARLVTGDGPDPLLTGSGLEAAWTEREDGHAVLAEGLAGLDRVRELARWDALGFAMLRRAVLRGAALRGGLRQTVDVTAARIDLLAASDGSGLVSAADVVTPRARRLELTYHLRAP